jgi:uncharacterized surface anchored protein
LKGAEFTLVKKNKDGSTKNVDVVKNAEGTSFTFKGLDAGNYVLEETKTPDGYNTIKPIEFTIGRARGLPSLSLVCPSNCKCSSGTKIESTADSPSR